MGHRIYTTFRKSENGKEYKPLNYAGSTLNDYKGRYLYCLLHENNLLDKIKPLKRYGYFPDGDCGRYQISRENIIEILSNKNLLTKILNSINDEYIKDEKYDEDKKWEIERDLETIQFHIDESNRRFGIEFSVRMVAISIWNIIIKLWPNVWILPDDIWTVSILAEIYIYIEGQKDIKHVVFDEG